MEELVSALPLNRQMYANHKCTLSEPQVEAYLAGRNIYPRTIEMDLTNRCTRACPTCPSAGSSMPAQVITADFADRFFAVLEGHTHGVIFSGGEPTSSPYYLDIIRLARRRGFKEIATISNGSELERPEIQDALMEHGTAIRVSLYDWYDNDTPAPTFFKQLERIAALRQRVDRDGSKLEIGVAMLTSAKRLPRMLTAARHAMKSGAHWLYFHPMCRDWNVARPVQEDQDGVLEAVADLRQTAPAGMGVFIPEQRYTRYPLQFSAFHSSHFLVQIGADGINYASPEAKYQANCALANLHEYMGDDFLWRPERLAAIRALNSDKYHFAGTRHRGAMFSDFIESCVQGKVESVKTIHTAREQDFLYPNLS
jgi:hypothetical protein